ncbi:MAG: penicillin-binding protein 1C [Flavobacteriaceae bacterium]|nr:penicillin-binding protein 1C [Flavobacteriaceae bacterium]MDZ4147140.1 penicillin-binding protein 1C [Flavobacteriaceae bacterium]
MKPSYIEFKILKTILQKNKIKVAVGILIFIVYLFSLPNPLFDEPTATVILSREGKLLGAKIATDEQWRFPAPDTLPKKFVQCLLSFEDQHFYKHPGFNPIAMFNALVDNVQAGKVVRGGSTLTQQVIRLSRKNKNRTYGEKLIELILATRLELGYSKDEILKFYCTYAPFGGNVVGIEAASWRYFGVSANQLSWAESASLAILPNAPGLIYPGKNQSIFLEKRNRLLKRLFQKQLIDSITYALSISEPIPSKPFAIPQKAPHFLQKVSLANVGKRTQTTLNFSMQTQVNDIVLRHYDRLSENQIFNVAVLVMDVKTREVLAYVGNTQTDRKHQKDVDVISAARSTGSVLKPLLYAAMLDDGKLLPDMLVADVPTEIAGYNPKNFDEKYDGAVTAKRALSRSLNVPAVRLLQEYGLQKFREQLRSFRLKNVNKSADYYGLSLILGGAESSLWDLTKTYASLASTVNHFNETSSEYFSNEFVEPIYILSEKADFGKKSTEKTLFDAGSIYLTFDAMKEVNRPEGNEAWEFFDSSKQIAWKTGTSFGNRDAWAVGLTADYAVGVWVGNADGEGRPNLTGVQSAAPILFDVFDLLPDSNWFDMPYDELEEAEVCMESGYLATPICPKKTVWIPRNGIHASSCSFHRWVQLDQNKQFQVNTSCENPDEMLMQSWFVLPPLMSYYFKNNHSEYKELPPFRNDCMAEQQRMEFIYPNKNGIVILPKNFESKTNPVILKVAHSLSEKVIFWYLDDQYIGQSKTFHEMTVSPKAGKHIITVVDESGIQLKRTFFVQ